jgi:hypothetical protein
MDLSQAFKILEIDETASFSEAKLAYRDLASVWHPDRHSQNSRLVGKSLQKMKDLNAAYDLLSFFYAESERSKPQSHHYEKEKTTIVTCERCGTQNRVQNLTDVMFKCGKCRSDLFSEEVFNDNEERILCGDGECIGIIRNGRCSECGKTLEEGKKEDKRKAKIYRDTCRIQEKVAKKKQKIKNVIKYGSIATVIILFGYGIYSESSNTATTQNCGLLQLVSPQETSLKQTQHTDVPQFSAKDFSGDLFKAGDLKELQEHLKTIGYKIDSIDGIVSPNTISECNKFSADFSYFSKFNSIAALLDFARNHATVSTVYPEWLGIVRGDLLKEWFAQQRFNFKKEIVSALKSNDSRKIIVVLNFYYFDKESPPQLQNPKNGIYWKSFLEGVASLKISTRDIEQSHIIKIIESGTNKEILKAFLRGGHSLEFDVPLGSYIITYAAGEKWYGEHFLFGPHTAFGKADNVFEFKQKGDQVSGYTVELYLLPHGNLQTSRLSAFQF